MPYRGDQKDSKGVEQKVVIRQIKPVRVSGGSGPGSGASALLSGIDPARPPKLQPSLGATRLRPSPTPRDQTGAR